MPRQAKTASVAFVLGLAAAASAPALRAQSTTTQKPDVAAPSPQSIPSFHTQIVVTPGRAAEDRNRVPAATAILTRDEIERLPVRALSDVLSALPGFHTVSASGFPASAATISRGFFGGGEAEYVKLLVDGIPVEDSESGVADWRHVPAFALSRIEAVRGPASALYGDTAIGGVVQAFTSPVDRRSARVEIGGGTPGPGWLHAQVAHPVGASAVAVNASYEDNQGFRDHSESRHGFASLSWLRKRDAHQWSGRAAYSLQQQQEPGPLNARQLAVSRSGADPMFRFDRQESRRAYGALRFELHSQGFQTSVMAHGAIRNLERLRTLLLAPGFGDPLHRDLATTTVGVSTENSVQTRFGVPGHLRFGADVSRSELDTTYRRVTADGGLGTAAASLKGHRWSTAFYASQAVDAGSRVRLQAGIRWDGLTDRVQDQTAATHTAWTPRAGVTVLLPPASRPIALFAQASRAFKAATLDQLFDPRPLPDFQGGTFQISNPRLRPQRATSIEAGLRQGSARYRWESVIYGMRVQDEIDFDPATFTYGNIGRSTHRGVELAGRFAPVPFLSIGAQYTWTQVMPSDSQRQLKNIPQHLFRPDLTLSSSRGWLLHAVYTRTARTYADDENTIALGDRSTVDLRLAKSFQRVVFRVDLLNVGGARYQEVGFTLPDFRGGSVPFFFPAPGFTGRAGVELRF